MNNEAKLIECREYLYKRKNIRIEMIEDIIQIILIKGNRRKPPYIGINRLIEKLLYPSREKVEETIIKDEIVYLLNKYKLDLEEVRIFEEKFKQALIQNGWKRTFKNISINLPVFEKNL